MLCIFSLIVYIILLDLGMLKITLKTILGV